MSALAKTSSIFTIAGATIISGLVAYAFYFDYKRRSVPTFRKKLRMLLFLYRRTPLKAVA